MSTQGNFYRQLSVRSLGMVSSIGLNASSSCAAIRARISRFEELPFHCQTGEPIIGAPATEAILNRQGTERVTTLLAHSVLECLNLQADRQYMLHNPPLIIAVIDTLDRPDYSSELPRKILEDLQRILKITFVKGSTIMPSGKIGFFRALTHAKQILDDGHSDYCIIAAADSMLNVRALRWLEEHNRLKTEDNSDGVIPSEASAAFWITKADNCKDSMLDIAGIGFGEEASTFEEDSPNLAIGLADAMRGALNNARTSLSHIDFRVGAMTGQQWEFVEASTALARVQRVHKEDFELLVPAEQLGDVGAALPACMLAAVTIGIQKGYVPGPSAILYSSSRSSERAACVVVAGKEDING